MERILSITEHSATKKILGTVNNHKHINNNTFKPTPIYSTHIQTYTLPVIHVLQLQQEVHRTHSYFCAA